MKFFLVTTEDVSCRYSLKVLSQGTSDEYQPAEEIRCVFYDV